MDGTYFFADYGTARIWTFKVVGGAVTEFTERTAELAPGGGRSIASIDSFGEDERSRGSTTTGEVTRSSPRPVCPTSTATGWSASLDFLDLLAHWGTCPISECDWDLDRDGNTTRVAPRLGGT